MGRQWPAAGSGALNATVQAQVLLKEAAVTSITPTTVCLRPNNREGTQSHPQEKTGYKIY